MYKNYCKLRDLKGVKDAHVAQATGITKSTFSAWKNGTYNPKPEKLQKIADYFNVSLEYLMTGEHINEEQGYYTNPETAQVAQEIFENKELRLLFDAGRNAKPEDLKLAHEMLLALKRKEQGEFD